MAKTLKHSPHSKLLLRSENSKLFYYFKWWKLDYRELAGDKWLGPDKRHNRPLSCGTMLSLRRIKSFVFVRLASHWIRVFILLRVNMAPCDKGLLFISHRLPRRRLLARHVYPTHRWGGEIAWLANRTSARDATTHLDVTFLGCIMNSWETWNVFCGNEWHNSRTLYVK